MKILVIGGTGFLSGAVVSECQKAGHDVFIVTRGSQNRPAPPPGVQILPADRGDALALKNTIGDRTFDLVVDCVLYKPDDARTAVEIFQKRTACYVFISTDFVYGGEPRLYPIHEDAPRRALSPYGVNKAACEDVFFAAWEQEQFPGVVLRPPHIMGRGSLLGSGSLEGRDPWLLWRLKHKQPILLLDNGELLIQPTHKTDIARAALAVFAALDKTRGRAYNICGPDCVTTRRYYEMVCEAEGLPLDNLVVVSLSSSAYVGAFPDRAPFTQNRVYSTARLQADTGCVPSFSLEACIAEVAAEYHEKGGPSGGPPAINAPLVAALRDATEQAAQLLKAGV